MLASWSSGDRSELQRAGERTGRGKQEGDQMHCASDESWQLSGMLPWPERQLLQGALQIQRHAYVTAISTFQHINPMHKKLFYFFRLIQLIWYSSLKVPKFSYWQLNTKRFRITQCLFEKLQKIVMKSTKWLRVASWKKSNYNFSYNESNTVCNLFREYLV